jgi:hypothetical protein
VADIPDDFWGQLSEPGAVETGRQEETPAVLPRRRAKEPYFGKVPLRWLRRATALGPTPWLAACAVWFEAGCRRSASVTIPARTRDWFGVSCRRKFRRALAALQEAGLVRVEDRPGSHSRITILDVP